MTAHIDFAWKAELYSVVATHLRTAPERIAFMQASDDSVPTIGELMLMDDGDVIFGEWCVQLTDAAQQRVLQWASSGTGWLVEAHSHLGSWGDPAAFSGLDLRSFAEWVPHARWRLRWRPYAALVFGPQTFDGLAWQGHRETSAVQVGASLIDGSVEHATCQTLNPGEALS